MEHFIAILHTWAIGVGFWGVVAFAFLQEVFPPLPSTAVAMSLGFLLFAGQPVTGASMWQLFVHVGLPIGLGLTVGAVIVYYVVLKLGMSIIDRWGALLGVTRDDIERLQARMQGTRRDDLILFAARAFPLVPSVAVNIIAGIIKTPLVTFIVVTFTGTVVRAMWSAFIGWQVGSAFESYAAVIERIQTYLLCGGVVVVIGYMIYRRKKQAVKTTSSSLHEAD